MTDSSSVHISLPTRPPSSASRSSSDGTTPATAWGVRARRLATHNPRAPQACQSIATVWPELAVQHSSKPYLLRSSQSPPPPRWCFLAATSFSVHLATTQTCLESSLKTITQSCHSSTSSSSLSPPLLFQTSFHFSRQCCTLT